MLNNNIEDILELSYQYITSRNKIVKILRNLYDNDRALYNQIINSKGIAYYKNNSKPFAKLINYYDNQFKQLKHKENIKLNNSLKHNHTPHNGKNSSARVPDEFFLSCYDVYNSFNSPEDDYDNYYQDEEYGNNQIDQYYDDGSAGYDEENHYPREDNYYSD